MLALLRHARQRWPSHHQAQRVLRHLPWLAQCQGVATAARQMRPSAT